LINGFDVIELENRYWTKSGNQSVPVDLMIFACGQKIIIKSHEAARQISRLSVKRAAVSISLL